MCVAGFAHGCARADAVSRRETVLVCCFRRQMLLLASDRILYGRATTLLVGILVTRFGPRGNHRMRNPPPRVPGRPSVGRCIARETFEDGRGCYPCCLSGNVSAVMPNDSRSEAALS